MIRIIVVVVAALAFVAFSSDPTKADEAPWCAVTNTGLDMNWDCRYQSAEQCAPAVVAGNRGFCNHSPYFVAQQAERRSQKRRRI